MGRINNDGIGVGNVYTVFHNRGRNQHVIVIIHKVQNDLFQLGRRHLSVPHHHPRIGHILVDQRCKIGQRSHTVGHDIDLSVPAHLELHGLGYDFMAERMHLRPDGVTVGRRSLDHREVARSHQRKLQGTGDGSGRHGERVHIHLQLTQSLLHRHTEFLFLVHNEQSQILELH